MTGKICKLHAGFGFIVGEDKKQYFFHHTALDADETGVRFDTLQEQTEVEFEDTTTEKGLRAEHVRLI